MNSALYIKSQNPSHMKVLIILFVFVCEFSYGQNCEQFHDKMPFCLGDTVKFWNSCSQFSDSTVWYIGTDMNNLKKIVGDTVLYIVKDTSEFNPFKLKLDFAYVKSINYSNFFIYKEITLLTWFYVCPITNPQFIASKQSICESESIDFFDRSDKLPTAWEWTFEGAVNPKSSEQNPKGIYYNKAGKYKVTLNVWNTKGKKTVEVADYIEVRPKKYQQQDTVTNIRAFLDATITLQACQKGEKYEWMPNKNLDCINCETTRLGVKIPETYTCTIKNDKYCDIVCKYSIKVDSLAKLYIPNTFSPNGDEQNDNFEIFGKNIQFLKLTIFDKWGNMVFQTEDPNTSWNGSFKEQPVAQGVFAYVFEYINLIDRKKYFQEGAITVVRY